jgi:hypothetical protein
LINAIRWNGHSDTYELVRIVEEHLEMVNTYYALRTKDTFDGRNPSSFPIFKTPDIINLQISKCIWQLDARTKTNWLQLLGILHEKKIYNSLIGYHPHEQAFICQWRRNSNEIKILCWNCKEKHTDLLRSTEVIWNIDKFWNQL